MESDGFFIHVTHDVIAGVCLGSTLIQVRRVERNLIQVHPQLSKSNPATNLLMLQERGKDEE